MVHAIQEQVDQGQAVELGYVSGYFRTIVPGVTLEQIVCGVERDARLLGDLFGVTLAPNIDYVHDVWKSGKLPAWVENFFVVMPWTAYFDVSSYGIAVMKLFEKVFGSSSNELASIESLGDLDVTSLFENQRKVDFMKRANLTQGCRTCLVLPAQLGLRYRNVIPNKVLDLWSGNEVALGVFETLCILYVHKNRFGSPKDMELGLAGDIYRPEYASESYLPVFSSPYGTLNYSVTGSMTMAKRSLGIPSAFTL